jgi:hypothetical protein
MRRKKIPKFHTEKTKEKIRKSLDKMVRKKRK